MGTACTIRTGLKGGLMTDQRAHPSHHLANYLIEKGASTDARIYVHVNSYCPQYVLGIILLSQHLN